MRIAVIVICALPVAYILTAAVYLWFKRGSDRVNLLVHNEHRDGSEPIAVMSAFAHLNPSYRFRRYSDDERLVTHFPAPSASALAEESR